ncbi:hypothetical protein BJV77DRAFT_622124 [Russula vinacea]|nr:hypothetical protein BJV77DRAFT_622124 [Russula vinacea]
MWYASWAIQNLTSLEVDCGLCWRAPTGLVSCCAACATGIVAVPSFPEHDTPGSMTVLSAAVALAAASPFTVRRVDKERHPSQDDGIPDQTNVSPSRILSSNSHQPSFQT